MFSKWLRHEIDVQASDPASASAEETTDRDLGIDYSQLLAYIQGAMEESKLDPFVWMADDPSAINAHSSMYEDVKKSLRAYKKRDEGNSEFLNLASHFDGWKRHNRDLVDQITSHQRASSSINFGLVLEHGNHAALDMRMVYEDYLPLAQKRDCVTTYTAFVPEKKTSRGK
jgi:anaphase-promoting complex subunit 4